ncbi:MAG: 3'(2'),5'-bisphosphate nucleotidase CysQ [Acidobacteriota bacterium]|nr:3'(2'),5'-bisphosphate nucleotidase CysQ [Acidobacteriota bacterium]MDH3784999.1 3'(2'),5'-bisphosphate nucleotidase CysQ [Acidobacteriota bacterium]
MSRTDDLKRIEAALARACAVVSRFTPGEIEHRVKSGNDPVTEADTSINDCLLETLPRDGEGWLSEETVDSEERLGKERVWVVDPLDGTREFVAGIAEWCISIGLVENGRAVAGGIAVPSHDLTVIGSLETGVLTNGQKTTVRPHADVDGITVLASRSEVRRGQWDRWNAGPIKVEPTGSVAYKMALVAAGRADATWTLVPKHEWDVAGGTALVLAAGGAVWTVEGEEPIFNRRHPLFRGLIAVPGTLEDPVRVLLAEAIAELD